MQNLSPPEFEITKIEKNSNVYQTDEKYYIVLIEAITGVSRTQVLVDLNLLPFCMYVAKSYMFMYIVNDGTWEEVSTKGC